MDPTGNPKLKYWLIGLAVAAVALYLLLRSPSNGGGGTSSTTLYTTGLSPGQATSLAQSGMNLQLGLAQTKAGETVNLAGINAAQDVANKQTAAAVSINSSNNATTVQTSNILANLEEALGKLQLQGLENTNQTNQSIVANEGSTLIGLQPSWLSQLLNGAGAINLQNQSGSLARTSATSFSSMITGLFGGGSGKGSGGGGSSILGSLGSLFGGSGGGAGVGSILSI